MLNFLMGWKGYAASLALGALIAAYSTWRIMSWQAEAAQTHQAQQTIKYVIGASNITYDIAMHYEGNLENDKAQTAKFLNQVPVAIPAAANAVCPIGDGFISLWNDASAKSSIPGN